MKNSNSHRFRLVLTILVVIFLQRTSFAQDYSIYDSIQQLESRIKQAGNATLVINFWATWCQPCVEELPHFEKLKDKFPDNDIQVILVSLDFKSQLEKKFLPFLRDRNLKSEVVLLADQDVNTWIPKIEEEWDGAIPATIVFQGQKKNFPWASLIPSKNSAPLCSLL